MIIYGNPKEINFEGTFRLTRNKLIPVDDCELTTDPENTINLNNFKHLGDFGKYTADLQKFCYDKNVRINMVYITETLEQLISIYKYYKLYKNLEKDGVQQQLATFAFADFSNAAFLFLVTFAIST